MKKTIIVSVIAGILLIGFAQTAVVALDYPTKPVTMINPNAPGGLFDVIGRTFAAAAERVLGKFVMSSSLSNRNTEGMQNRRLWQHSG